MPPKSDPYSSPRARFCDLLLCLLTIALIIVAFLTAPRQFRVHASERANAPTTELAVK